MGVGVVVGVLVASKRIPPFLALKPVYVGVVVGVLADQGHVVAGVLAAPKRILPFLPHDLKLLKPVPSTAAAQQQTAAARQLMRRHLMDAFRRWTSPH